MTFISRKENTGEQYNNADSFAMEFDSAWKGIDKDLKFKDQDEKINEVLKIMSDHPFLKNNQSQAIEVAKFRIKLLDLT